jgi:hypothetical protein
VELCQGEVQHSLDPDGPGPPAKKRDVRAAHLKGKGGNRGPPRRCDTYNPTIAKRAPHLPGGHNQLYQVAISRSLLSTGPDDRGPQARGGYVLTAG